MKLRHLVFIVLSVGIMSLLSGCHLELLEPKGMIAAKEARLLVDSVLLMLIVVVPTIILAIYVSWKYRASNKKAEYKPKWAHSNIVEIICWGVPSIIIVILAIMTWVGSHELDPYKPLNINKKPVIIQAISLNWKWLFIYPKQNFATINYVQIPVNTPVRFLITSDAPMNSLEIPQLAGQIYAMAGMRTKLNLIGDTVGVYRGLSTNFSGDGFSGMHFAVRVSTKAQFDEWVKGAQHAPTALSIKEYNKLTLPTEHNKVQYYAPVADKLFHNVIMKFMMPMPKMDVADDGTKVNR